MTKGGRNGKKETDDKMRGTVKKEKDDKKTRTTLDPPHSSRYTANCRSFLLEEP